LVMAGHQLLELLVADIAQLERANGCRQPVRQRGRLLRGLELGLRGVEALHHHAAHHLDDGLGAVDARIVVLLQIALHRLEGLLQHWRVAPMSAGLADAGAPVQGHTAAPTIRSASGTRSSPEISLGSRVSRSWARERDCCALLTN